MKIVETYDAGSIPFYGDWERYLKGAKPINPLYSLLYPPQVEEIQRYFDERVTDGFIYKLKAGIDIPNYPQFRDMNEMFLDSFAGIERTSQGYIQTESIENKSRELEIPEIAALKRHSKDIAEENGSPFKLKICITGPYTLASMLVEKRTETFNEFANVLSKIIEANIFDGKYGGVKLLFIEEPTFGLIDDPLLDFGKQGREILLHAWEHLFDAVKIKGVQRGFHLHSTRDGLFWGVKPFDIVESHVNDPIYESTKTKEILEKNDKFIKASIAVTDFDSLIRRHYVSKGNQVDEISLNEKVGNTWVNIRKNLVDPLEFIEEVGLMQKRLATIVSYFGEERVPYAGPECGLRGFPTLNSAFELLKRVSKAAHSL